MLLLCLRRGFIHLQEDFKVLYLRMANFNKPLAVIFTFLFLYIYTYTESQYRFVLIQKEVSHSKDSDSHISQNHSLHTFPYNTEEKNISSGKSAYHWFTRFSSEASQVTADHNRNNGHYRLISRLIFSNEVSPNFTVRIKIFPFHYFL